MIETQPPEQANEQRPKQASTTQQPRVFTRTDFAAYREAWHAGERCEITEDLFMEFLEALPPVFMGKRVMLSDASEVFAQFGFVEGADRITAFWRERLAGTQNYRYFSQYTNHWSKG